MGKERAEIPDKHKWNVESLYSSSKAWEKEYNFLAREKEQRVRFPTIKQMRGTIGIGPVELAELLKHVFDLERKILKLYTYAHLRHDEDVVHETHKSMHDRISFLCHEYENETSWIKPEILQLDAATFQHYLQDPALRDYRVYLQKIYTLKPHTLSSSQEDLLSLAGKTFETPRKAFNLLNDADLKFPKVVDEKGEEKELSYGTYLLYMQSKDRTLRKNTFISLHRKYEEFENTICELINGHVQKCLFLAKARNYPSSLHAALIPHHIDPAIYHNLIETVRENIPCLHRYISLRKKVLGLENIHFYDLYVSLVPKFEKKFSYEEAKECILESLQVMGPEYQEILSGGLGEERWVDLYHNNRKRSGAYSGGCYDSFPYILMNYQGTLRDVLTLSHEAGHSMHTYLSNKGQPYQYSHYPIFLAEIASTFHEDILSRFLLKKASTRAEKCYFLNQKIEDIRATLFRQTLFAEFELKIHSLAEQGVPLTPTVLKEVYRQLNIDYYGPDLTLDPEVGVEYLRIPHFYSDFYVYQYATGISAAYTLVEKVLNGGDTAREVYFTLLSSGSSQSPLELLKSAGVDMRSKGPIEQLLRYFDELLTQLEEELVT